MFKNPIAPRDQKPKDKPVDGKNSPWDYTCPQYDQRSSVFVKTGTDYGTGFNVPVGNKEAPRKTGETLPSGCKQEVDDY